MERPTYDLNFNDTGDAEYCRRAANYCRSESQKLNETLQSCYLRHCFPPKSALEVSITLTCLYSALFLTGAFGTFKLNGFLR